MNHNNNSVSSPQLPELPLLQLCTIVVHARALYLSCACRYLYLRALLRVYMKPYIKVFTFDVTKSEIFEFRTRFRLTFLVRAKFT
jgi:hypothetical protein